MTYSLPKPLRKGRFCYAKNRAKKRKWQLGVRLAYIQVGGEADGAADAAPSPARCARGRRSQAYTRTTKRANRNKQGSQKVLKNFLGRGDVTKQNRRVATASLLNSEVYGDEATARAFAAEPLGESPAYTVAPCLDFHRHMIRYVTFGSCAITSGLTVPIYSPSSQQLNLSERINFFSFSP